MGHSSTPVYVCQKCGTLLNENVHPSNNGVTAITPCENCSNLSLLDEIYEIARGQQGPQTTGEFEEDARNTYPKRLKMILDLIEDSNCRKDSNAEVLNV